MLNQNFPDFLMPPARVIFAGAQKSTPFSSEFLGDFVTQLYIKLVSLLPLFLHGFSFDESLAVLFRHIFTGGCLAPIQKDCTALFALCVKLLFQ